MREVKQLVLPCGRIALIDAEDFETPHEVAFPCGILWRGTIASRCWRSKVKRHTTYAVCTLGGAFELRLHRVILDAPADRLVDHRDGNGLNNTRANLRFATALGNAQNRRKNDSFSSAFKGVSRHLDTDKWEAYIRVNKVKKHLGLFSSEREAAAAYDAAARQYFGEFACVNAVACARRVNAEAVVTLSSGRAS